MKIDDLASTVRFDSDALENQLAWIKERYRQRENEYKSEQSESELTGLLSDIGTSAKTLARRLASAPFYLKSEFNMRCARKVIKDPRGKDEDTYIAYDHKSFVDDAIQRLNEIARVSSETSVTKIGQKKMSHRSWLLEDLRNSWETLAGSPPSKSSSKNQFIAYMEFACEYMDIDSSGLARRHRNTK